jgi:hypothetical protein
MREINEKDISWNQRFTDGNQRKGNKSNSTFGTVGLGTVSDFTIYVIGKRINVVIPCTDASMKIHRCIHRDKNIITAITITLKPKCYDPVCWWKDFDLDNTTCVFQTTDTTTLKQFESDEKLYMLPQYNILNITYEFKTNTVHVCQA